MNQDEEKTKDESEQEPPKLQGTLPDNSSPIPEKNEIDISTPVIQEIENIKGPVIYFERNPWVSNASENDTRNEIPDPPKASIETAALKDKNGNKEK